MSEYACDPHDTAGAVFVLIMFCCTCYVVSRVVFRAFTFFSDRKPQ